MAEEMVKTNSEINIAKIKDKAEKPGTIASAAGDEDLETTTGDEDLEHIIDLFERMEDNIEELPDSDTKNALKSGYKIINRNFGKISRKLETTEQEKLRMKIQKNESTANILCQYLKKDLVATVIGAVLLLIIVLAYSIGMLIKVEYPVILSDAFLLILGFFFGASKST